jgi:3-methyladenine DNA glycosylase/8-oxoguanine DNA glycosylase
VRTIDLPLPLDLRRSLSPLVASHRDPTIRLREDAVVRAAWTPTGPGTLLVERGGDRRYRATAWGPGEEWLLAQAPALLGGEDDLYGFDPTRHPAVARVAHHRPALRIVRSGLVWDLLVSTILAQRVTSGEAARSWTRLVRQHGTPAPGPYGVLLPPTPEVCASLPPWTWHRLGVERSRATAIASASRRVAYLQRTLALDGGARREAFTRVPGVGPWTAALVLRVAAGDADAVEVGDFHVKHQVSFNLADEPRGTDERMLELLAPFAGHRGRVVRLLTNAGRRPPAFAAKLRVVPVHQL